MTEDEMVGWHHQLNGHEFALPTLAGDFLTTSATWEAQSSPRGLKAGGEGDDRG